MAVPIAIVAQHSMDLYYTNYKANSEFFALEDFIAHCAGIVGAVYMAEYQKMRAEMRQEKRDEIISFDPGSLIEQILEVQEENGELFSLLKSPVMTFPFDEQGVGVQDIFPIKPNDNIFERTTTAGRYQLKYTPTCSIIWFYVSAKANRINYINKTLTNLKQVKILTVPSVSDPNMMVPDGIFEYVVTTGAQTIKEGAKGVVVKKSGDQNANKLIQTEADLSSLK